MTTFHNPTYPTRSPMLGATFLSLLLLICWRTVSASMAWASPDFVVLGAEGPGLRQKTKEAVDHLVKIDAAGGFGSLNVSNAAAIALYASLPR